MNIKEIIYLAWRNIKGNKFKSFTFISVISLFMLLVICFFTGTNSYKIAVERLLLTDPSVRILYIDALNNEENEEVVNKINSLNIPEIVKVFKDYTEIKIIAELSLDEDNISEYFYIQGLYDGIYFDKLDAGRQIENDNEIICPSDFYLNLYDSHKKPIHIDLKKYVGKSLKGTYTQYILDNTGNSISNIINNIELTLVGTFDNEIYNIEYGKCFTKVSYFEKIIPTAKTIYPDDFNYEELHYTKGVYALVKNYEDAEPTVNKLKAAGLDAGRPMPDFSTFDTFKTISIIGSIALLIISIKCINIFINNYLKEQQKNLALYRLIGFSNKEENKMIYSQFFILITIAGISSVIISYILKIIFDIVIENYPLYKMLDIHMSFIEFIIYFIIIIFIVIRVVIVKSKKLKNNSLIEVSGG